MTWLLWGGCMLDENHLPMQMSYLHISVFAVNNVDVDVDVDSTSLKHHHHLNRNYISWIKRKLDFGE